MTSVFPVEMLGVLRMIVAIPLFSVWARGRKELLGGGEADCLAIQGRQETEMLFPPNFPCWFPFCFYLTEVPPPTGSLPGYTSPVFSLFTRLVVLLVGHRIVGMGSRTDSTTT